MIKVKLSKYTNDCNRELKYRFLSLIGSAKKRGHPWELSFARFKLLLGLECLYCGGTATGIDRIDSSRGYFDDNSVPCCGECNQLKSYLNILDFITRYKERLAKKYLINRIIAH